MQKKYIISIWWGYCSGAALFEYVDRTLSLVAASSEERFTREKNSVQFPYKTLSWLGREYGVSKENILSVTCTGSDVGSDYILLNKHRWEISDYLIENRIFWHKVLIENIPLTNDDYYRLFAEKLDTSQFPGSECWHRWIQSHGYNFNDNWDVIVDDVIRSWFSDTNGEIKIFRADHHESHAFYAYCSSGIDSQEATLVFTADGWGDGRNATVSIIGLDARGVLQKAEVHSSVSCIIGRIYRYMTLLLGMKPSDHEFKVMGLAPYGKSEFNEKSYRVFKDAMHFSDGDFHINPKLTDSYYWFRDRLEGERFDNIANGLQKWLEENLVEWVNYYVERTGIRRVAFSGGVAMNVKAMGVIAQLPKVQTLHVPPSSGDESHIFGAAYAYIYSLGEPVSYTNLSRVPYLGYRSARSEELALVESIKEMNIGRNTYKVHQYPTPNLVAQYLARGYSIGICRGSAEFGARALGNRSIVIDPTNGALKERLNLSIKNRDFWMPFAPIVIDKYLNTYLNNVNRHQTKYMTVAFDTTVIGRQALLHAVHPSDGSCRVQNLSENDNPYLYKVICHFDSITSKGGLLNTSFNVHGAPIVNTVLDAFDIFRATEIDCLLLNDYFITKVS